MYPGHVVTPILKSIIEPDMKSFLIGATNPTSTVVVPIVSETEASTSADSK